MVTSGRKAFHQPVALVEDRVGHELHVRQIREIGWTSLDVEIVVCHAEVASPAQSGMNEPPVQVRLVPTARKVDTRTAVPGHPDIRDAKGERELDDDTPDCRLVVDVVVRVEMRHRQALATAPLDLGTELLGHGISFRAGEPERSTA